MIAGLWLVVVFVLAGYDVLKSNGRSATAWAVLLLDLLFLLALFGVITRGT